MSVLEINLTFHVIPVIVMSHFISVLLLGTGGVGGLDQGEELHPGSSGLWERPEQCAALTAETQDSGWRAVGSPLTAAGLFVFLFLVRESAPSINDLLSELTHCFD